MYDFYPNDSRDPRNVAPFVLRATQAELDKWGVGLDELDERDMRETLAADRATTHIEVVVPAKAMPELTMPRDTPLQRTFS